MNSELKTINIALIAMVTQKNNIQHIYIGINTTFVENGVCMIESITYVKHYEEKNKKNDPFTPFLSETAHTPFHIFNEK
jgi:hypothetical protein